jgi:His/Glu/Gln/Arg/opine family amino acid ABC transporter permease subunit
MKQKLFPIIFTLMLYFLFFAFLLSRVADVLDFNALRDFIPSILKATAVTVLISVLSLFLSMVLGLWIFLMTESPNSYFRLPAQVYKEIIMGTPLLVLVFVVVYVIGTAFGMRNKLNLGLLSLTLYMSPYMSNIFEGAYNTIGKAQFTIMDFYGFSLLQRYRYIILPQMIKPSIPGLINNLSGIIKGTSILSTIAIGEIFYTTTVFSNRTYRYIEGYFVLWVVYLMITVPLSYLAKYVSRSRQGVM